MTDELASANSAKDRAATDARGRRGFIKNVSSVAMCGGLAAGYGTFAVMAGKYLLQSVDDTDWLYVTRIDQLPLGKAFNYTAPNGANVVIARKSEADDIASFVALSSTCPHLGCQVFWEPQNDRFFCPCHNGVFDPDGVATEGPPADAGQSLKQFPLRLQNNMLFIRVPLKSILQNGEA